MATLRWPSRVSACAVARPVIPAPTIAMSAGSGTRQPYQPGSDPERSPLHFRCSSVRGLTPGLPDQWRSICFLVWYSVRSGAIGPMYDYGFFSYESKDEFLDRSREFWNPDKTDFWQ